MDFSAFTQNNNSGSLNLQKEGVLNLTKQAPQITRYILGGGWDMAVAGPAADLDLSSFLLNANGQVEQVPQDVIFFNNKKAQGIYLEGDNRTGQGEGDDERIQIDLSQIENRIERIVFFMTIFDAHTNNQTFGMIKNAYVRLLDANTENEVCRYDLTDNYATDTAIIACALNRTPNGWTFEAIGDGLDGNLQNLLDRYRNY